MKGLIYLFENIKNNIIFKIIIWQSIFAVITVIAALVIKLCALPVYNEIAEFYKINIENDTTISKVVDI